MCLMAINAVYFGWKFMEVSAPQSMVEERSMPQVGPRVQLLGESNLLAAQSASPVPGPEESTRPAVEAVPVRQCFNVGPFGNEGEAKGLVSHFKGKRFNVRLDKRKVDVKDYWVFIPAFTNRERAEDKLRELRARGISGFVVKEGPFVNAISLNHFSQKDLAQAFLAKMQETGLSVESREITNPGTQVWAYVSPGLSKAELRSAVDEFLAGRQTLKREIASCEE